MEALESFLKSSTVIDLLVLLFILFITVVMIPIGILIVFASRSSKPAYIFLLSAVLPLVLALIGTCLRFASIEEAVRPNPGVGEEVILIARQEAWITTYIGAAGTTILALIGAAAVVKKAGES